MNNIMIFIIKNYRIRQKIIYLCFYLFFGYGLYNSTSRTLPTIGSETQTIPQHSHHEEISRNDKQRNDVNLKSIRRWGCSRNETPFIFVHIGKAGGGEIRRIIAAAAFNYTEPTGHRALTRAQKKGLKGGKAIAEEVIWNKQEGAYHIINVDLSPNGPSANNSAVTTITARARFSNSDHPNFRPGLAFVKKGSFEGNRKCDAETPIGQAAMCPSINKSRCPNEDADPVSPSASCHLVYVGHNLFGNEMHWLPRGYLRRWWDSIIDNSSGGIGFIGDNTATDNIPSWEDIPDWSNCGEYDQRQKKPLTPEVQRCRKHLGHEIDSLASRAFSLVYGGVKHTIDELEDNNITIPSWAPIYASLPVLRVTMIREPFSWLASKYLWHHLDTKDRTHDNIEEMTKRYNTTENFASSQNKKTPRQQGWANHYALGYIMHLCGEDCLVRYVHGSATLNDVVRQAEENLRHSFAVVGLLTETDTFYNMVSARVAYMVNLTQNAHLIKGGKHDTKDHVGVKMTYADPKFQQQVIHASPEIAALVKLYEVAVEVNQFQLKELSSCPSWNSSER